MEASRRIGVLWPICFLINCQRTLQERFGLLVLALCIINRRQVVEASRRAGVLWPICFLINCQRTLQERFGLRILSSSVEIVCSFIEEMGCFRKFQVIV